MTAQVDVIDDAEQAAFSLVHLATHLGPVDTLNWGRRHASPALSLSRDYPVLYRPRDNPCCDRLAGAARPRAAL